MPIQHSSNFQKPLMRTMISLLEISQERLMEEVTGDKQKHVDVLFTAANLFAQEIEALQNEVDRLQSLNKTMGDVIWKDVHV